jgi:hypothetical protein
MMSYGLLVYNVLIPSRVDDRRVLGGSLPQLKRDKSHHINEHISLPPSPHATDIWRKRYHYSMSCIYMAPFDITDIKCRAKDNKGRVSSTRSRVWPGWLVPAGAV